jgi:polyphosphate kinase 2
MEKKAYRKMLYDLQVELVKFQKSVIGEEKRVFLIFEGRDAAGKDGTIKRFTEHMSPRETRVVALPKPSDRDRRSWYFQRYVPHLPSGQEIVFFNRSWYNRAGVERVFGFCTEEEYKLFMEEVGDFEHMLTRSKMIFFKYYLDISREEQKRRLEARHTDPLKQWKISSLDEKAQEKWEAYSKARDEMFVKTDFVYAPWHVVHTDEKKEARINVMQHFLSAVEYEGKDENKLLYDNDIVFPFSREALEKGKIFP